jgi:hypothetical protein
MLIAGNYKTYEVTIANGAHGELDLSSIVGTENLIKINPNAANVRILFTAPTSTDVADVQDYLLVNAETEFEVGRGLRRLSLYNGSGAQVKVSIAVLF